jgi:hypothetical protein
MNTQDENKKQDQSTWKKHFSGKNFLINGLIAIIPASLVMGILRELGLRGALVTVGILFGFVYLAGFIREKISGRKQEKSTPKVIESSVENQPATTNNNKNNSSKKKWVWVGVILIVLVVIIVLASNSPSENEQDISLLKTDKSSDYSEQVGNLYRNTKYHFRIKFPEGWTVGVGDGIHIVQKASFENSTISIMVQQLDLSGSEGFTSINDAGTPKEFIDTVIEGAKEKFSDVKIINYGETKIDNEPAYWVEYSMSSQVLDYQLKMTQLVYFLAKGDTMYSINTGTATDEYSKIKPLFVQTVSTFVLENY